MIRRQSDARSAAGANTLTGTVQWTTQERVIHGTPVARAVLGGYAGVQHGITADRIQELAQQYDAIGPIATNPRPVSSADDVAERPKLAVYFGVQQPAAA